MCWLQNISIKLCVKPPVEIRRGPEPAHEEDFLPACKSSVEQRAGRVGVQEVRTYPGWFTVSLDDAFFLCRDKFPCTIPRFGENFLEGVSVSHVNIYLGNLVSPRSLKEHAYLEIGKLSPLTFTFDFFKALEGGLI